MGLSQFLSAGILLTLFLSLPALTQQAQDNTDRAQDRAATQQRERVRDPNSPRHSEEILERERKQSREHERLYGEDLMSEEERLQFRVQLRQAKTEEERRQLMEQHRAVIQARAKERGVTVVDDETDR